MSVSEFHSSFQEVFTYQFLQTREKVFLPFLVCLGLDLCFLIPLFGLLPADIQGSPLKTFCFLILVLLLTYTHGFLFKLVGMPSVHDRDPASPWDGCLGRVGFKTSGSVFCHMHLPVLCMFLIAMAWSSDMASRGNSVALICVVLSFPSHLFALLIFSCVTLKTNAHLWFGLGMYRCVFYEDEEKSDSPESTPPIQSDHERLIENVTAIRISVSCALVELRTLMADSVAQMVCEYIDAHVAQVNLVFQKVVDDSASLFGTQLILRETHLGLLTLRQGFALLCGVKEFETLSRDSQKLCDFLWWMNQVERMRVFLSRLKVLDKHLNVFTSSLKKRRATDYPTNTPNIGQLQTILVHVSTNE